MFQIRIPGADGDPRPIDGEPGAQIGIEDGQNGLDPLPSESVGHLTKRAVDRRERDAEAPARQEHDRGALSTHLLQKLRVPRIRESGASEDFLRDRAPAYSSSISLSFWVRRMRSIKVISVLF